MNAVLPTPQLAAPRGIIDELHSACFGFRLDDEVLARALDSEPGQPGLSAMVREQVLAMAVTAGAGAGALFGTVA